MMEYTAIEDQVEVEVVESQHSHARLENGKVEITLHPKEKKDGERKCLTEKVRKILHGLVLVIGIALSWVSAMQFTKSTYSATFNAPFFVIWFSTIWNVICYPVYVTGAWVCLKEKRKGGLRVLFREDQKIFGPNGLTVLTYFKYIGPFCLCWMVTNYVYIRAVGIITVTDVTALFATNTAFVYICSWIWLKEKFILIPARVLFFRCVGNASFGQVSLFLSLLGLFNLVFFWPIMLILYLTNVETLDWGNLPVTFLCGGAALTLVFNFLVNFGIAITFPLFIALGTVVGIPLNGVVDWLVRGATFGALKIFGGALIVAGFLVMLVPESIQRKVACWEEGKCPCERQTLDQETGEPGEGAGQKDIGEREWQHKGETWPGLEQTEEEKDIHCATISPEVNVG
ncbi:solute carrier family 35 member F4-like isoform X2 [Acanthaster planci]|uniref:Solute carrier family 35 member F4-like isoform X2 n=1 Tax=Acanthaster planci TaxID=133434 RepID=A0A8B7Y8C3_ACAPL|nr:solute carrier family 35 member F4-like isoform X2 [Acanthaster planci]